MVGVRPREHEAVDDCGVSMPTSAAPRIALRVRLASDPWTYRVSSTRTWMVGITRG